MAIRPNNPGSIAEGRSNSALTEAIRQHGANSGGVLPILSKVVVEEVLFDPSMIDDTRAEYYMQTLGIGDSGFLRSLPPNTIIGKSLRDGNQVGSETSEYFFPFFPPHMMFPVKAGEHVWVYYENDKTTRYGYWWFRVTEPRHVDDLNHTHADRKFQGVDEKGPRDKAENENSDEIPGFGNSPIRKIAGESTAASIGVSYGEDEKAYENLLKTTDASKVHDYEDVPRFKKRPGDCAIQGSNNTLIVLGTDRIGAVADTDTDDEKGKIAKGKPPSDKQGKAGSIDVVVGRGQGDKTKPLTVQNTLGKQEIDKNLKKENPNEGDPDFETDLGRFYLSMKTDPDKNFNIQLTGIDKTDVSDGAPAGVIKVDHVRIVARKTIKFLVQPSFDAPESDCSGIVVQDNGDIIFVPSSKGIIKLGGSDADKALLGFNVGAQNQNGTVISPPLMTTMGGFAGQGGAHGIFATKILAK